jgi:hypothetical protein
MRAGATIYIGTSPWQMISSNLSSARLMFILPRHRRFARLVNSLRTMSWVEVLLLLSVHSFFVGTRLQLGFVCFLISLEYY